MAVVFTSSGCLLSKVQAQILLLPEATASFSVGCLKNQEGQLVREMDPGLALVM